MSGKPEMLKRINFNLVYDSLIALHSATRLEIANRTRVSLTTIRLLLDELLENGEIVETQLDESSGGRRAQRYSLNTRKNLILSLCIKEDCLTYQVTNLYGEVIEKGEKVINNYALWVDFAIDFIGEMLKQWNIVTIGIGACGIVQNGEVRMGCEIEKLVTYKIHEQIKSVYNVPVIIENDSNSVAFGYALRYLKSDKLIDCKSINLAYVDFDSSCVGAGFIVDGQILHGAEKFAGELSFMPLDENNSLGQKLKLAKNSEAVVSIICRVLCIISCITNPERIIISGKTLSQFDITIEQIALHLKNNYELKSICRAIEVVDCVSTDHLMGITEIAFHNVLPLLPLNL